MKKNIEKDKWWWWDLLFWGFLCFAAYGIFFSSVQGTVTQTTIITGNFTTEKFNGTGNATWICPSNVHFIEFLIVAGGGPGGSTSGDNRGGGGGAGGVIVNNSYPVIPGNTYNLHVGAGGLHTSGVGGNGENSTFDNLVAVGGGPGGATSVGGGGGSGGGGGASATAGIYQGGTPWGNQGYHGGIGGTDSATYREGGGGGGYSEAGNDAGVCYNQGDGGTGIMSLLENGTPQWYAGGGAGGSATTQSLPGRGGGGAKNSNATPETGGGGGGGRNHVGGDGGSGIILIRYQTITGGNDLTDAQYMMFVTFAALIAIMITILSVLHIWEWLAGRKLP